MARLIVIPARLASQRLPRKVLLDETGSPLIRHVYERCASVEGVERVVVAADGEEVAAAVRGFGGEVVITDPGLDSGTDRVAAAVKALGAADRLVVNVQGDEPEIDPGHVARLFDILSESEENAVATLAVERQDRAGFEDPNRVKVVLGSNTDLGSGASETCRFALYFSRASIPFPRESSAPLRWLCHVGTYGFRPGSLERFTAMGPTSLEKTERLEQLRFLQMGLRIRVQIVAEAAPGIDTPEDYRRFVADSRGKGTGE